ncbi:MAG: HDIG domain-containing protein [Candidatus Delongbacteria bacterium]|nr:HDIG domain-containing protein [Candidatus Delongbacteria bacterium]
MDLLHSFGITRDQALQLLHDYIKSEGMIRHCLATEAVMRELAGYFGEDQDFWGLTGLVHDLDIELTQADLSIHTLETEKILRSAGIHEEAIEAIKMHNEAVGGKERTDRFHIALAAGETITGLIMATALVYPDRKLTSVKSKSVVKRMKEKAFAAGVNRETIRECEKIGIPLDQFAERCLNAMLPIAGQLGLA